MNCEHDWKLAGSWGVVCGVSRCTKCDGIAVACEDCGKVLAQTDNEACRVIGNNDRPTTWLCRKCNADRAARWERRAMRVKA